MKSTSKSKHYVTHAILIGIFLSTISILPNSYNSYLALKAPVLSLFLGLTILAAVNSIQFKNLTQEKILVSSTGLFLSALLISGVISSANFSRVVWGEFDRKNGFLTYFCLTFLPILLVALRNQIQTRVMLNFIYISAGAISAYVTCQALGLNLLNETFIYGPLVGVFGNPNFTSSFLGIMSSFPIGFIFNSKKSRALHFLVLLYLVILIKQTGSIQGILLLVTSLACFTIMKLLELKKSRKMLLTFSGVTFLLGALVLLGLVGKGPLSSFLFRNSAQIRLGYFDAAIGMFKSSPIVGVGTDSYGDFFREFRKESLIKLIGDATTSNDAHNIFLNLLSTSGIVTFASYLFINLYCIFRGIKGLKKYPKSIELKIFLVASIGYSLQSLLSINNFGLAIWGWLFLGMIFVVCPKNELENKSSSAPHRSFFSKVFISIFAVILIAVSFLGFNRAREEVKLKNYTTNLLINADQNYKEVQFEQLSSITNYWISEVSPSLSIQNAFLVIGASEAAEVISNATFRGNPDSRDALWGLVDITTRRGNLELAIVLREKLIEKENRSNWVLLDQAESLIEIGNIDQAKVLIAEVQATGLSQERLEETRKLLLKP